MNRVILYHARLPGWLAPADAAGLVERIPYAKRVGLAARRVDREASLAGIALAVAAASTIRGRALAPETLRFAPGEKPVFATRDAPVFSIAHAGSTVVAVAAARGAIGVDVESGHSSGLSAALRREWTAREAVVKALGVGLRAAPEVRIEGERATLRGDTLRLLALHLPDGAEGWLATDFEPTGVERAMLDPLAELRRHAA